MDVIKEDLFQKKINDLIDVKINENSSYVLIDLIRDNFDVLEKALVLYKSSRVDGAVSASAVLTDVLNDCGIRTKSGEKISSSYFLKLMSLVRKEKGKSKVKVKIKMPTQATTAFRQRIAPMHKSRSASAVKPAEKKVITNKPFINKRELLSDLVKRLQDEQATGFVAWNDGDEYFLKEVLYKHYLEQKDGIFLDGFWETLDSREFEWSSNTLKSAYRLIKSKVETLGLMSEFIEL